MSDNKKMIFPSILITILILGYLLIGKNTEIATNLYLNNSIFVFPIAFIITGYMIHNIGSKNVKKSLNYSVLLFIGFLLILSIVSIFRSNQATYHYRAYMEYILIPVHTNIWGINFSMPNLIHVIFFTTSFYISLLIFITLYSAVKDYAPKTISFLISYIISYIIKILIFIGGTHLIRIFKNEIVFRDLIVALTSHFIGAIITTLFASFIYLFICIKLKKKNFVLFKNIS